MTATGIEAKVCEDIARRQQFGLHKYGTTVAENPLELRQWLQHAYEELLDAAVYTRRAMAELDKILGHDELADMVRAGKLATSWKDPGCWCEACDIATNGPFRSRMSLCPACGDKRCPRAKDHLEICSNPAQAQAGKGAQV